MAIIQTRMEARRPAILAGLSWARTILRGAWAWVFYKADNRILEESVNSTKSCTPAVSSDDLYKFVDVIKLNVLDQGDNAGGDASSYKTPASRMQLLYDRRCCEGIRDNNGSQQWTAGVEEEFFAGLRGGHICMIIEELIKHSDC